LQLAQCARTRKEVHRRAPFALNSAHRSAGHRRLLLLGSPPSASAAAIPGQYIVVLKDSVAAPLLAGTAALCLTNQCRVLTPQLVQKIVADARTYDEANRGHGFQGDPRRPICGKYCGYLIRGRAVRCGRAQEQPTGA
jgi:hypothetical protein